MLRLAHQHPLGQRRIVRALGLGQKSVLPREESPAPSLSPSLSCASKSRVAALRTREGRNFSDGEEACGDNNKLSDPMIVFDKIGFKAPVEEEDFNFARIIWINDTGGVSDDD